LFNISAAAELKFVLSLTSAAALLATAAIK
jgi:hypothetical protein